MQNSGANLPLWSLFIKFVIAIDIFKKLLNIAVLKEHLEMTGMEKI